MHLTTCFFVLANKTEFHKHQNIFEEKISSAILKKGVFNCSDFSSITEQPEAVTQTEGWTPVFQTTTLNANTGYAIQSDNFQL